MDDSQEDERLRLSCMNDFGRDSRSADLTVFWNAVKTARQRSFRENSSGKRVTRVTRVPGLTLSRDAYVARGLPPDLAALIERLAELGWSDLEALAAAPEVAAASPQILGQMAAEAEQLRTWGAEVVLTVQPGYVHGTATFDSVPLYELDRRALPPRSAGPVAATDLKAVTTQATSAASRRIFLSAVEKRVRAFAQQNLKWPGLLVRHGRAHPGGVHDRSTISRAHPGGVRDRSTISRAHPGGVHDRSTISGATPRGPSLAPAKTRRKYEGTPSMLSKYISGKMPAEALLRRQSTASGSKSTGPPMPNRQRSPSRCRLAPRPSVPPGKRKESQKKEVTES